MLVLSRKLFNPVPELDNFMTRKILVVHMNTKIVPTLVKGKWFCFIHCQIVNNMHHIRLRIQPQESPGISRYISSDAKDKFSKKDSKVSKKTMADMV
jgi:hypothetical protein